jgi:beta-N-acetylhexosaminidase
VSTTSPGSAMPLRQAAGQVLVVGLEGPELSALETAWLRLLKPGGVILFRRNIESADQTHALLQAARQTVDSPLLRCIDVEGGSVDRLRDLIAPMPSPFAVAATHKQVLFEKHGSLIGQEVRMLGLNTTFAPVLDLRTAASEKVMTTRVVGDASQVIRYATQFLDGLAQQGVLGCGKHFPGLGSGQVDSHHATPLITKPFDSLWKEDLLPYRRLAKQLPMVMISHAAYSAALPGATPPYGTASLPGGEPSSISYYWIAEILIRTIGYKGLIVSDDMEMGGILSYMGIAEAAVRSVTRGMHVVEICRDPALVFAAYEALLHEAESSRAFARLLRRAAARVQDFKTEMLKSDTLPPAPTTGAVNKLRGAVESFTAQVAKAGPA